MADRPEKKSAVLKGPAKICAEAEEARALMDSILEREGHGSAEGMFAQAARAAQQPLPEPKQGERTDLKELPSNGPKLNSGNSADYLLARLKRDHPELAEKVVSGEMTANAAAIEAGFRKKPSPFDSLKKAWAKASKIKRLGQARRHSASRCADFRKQSANLRRRRRAGLRAREKQPRDFHQAL